MDAFEQRMPAPGEVVFVKFQIPIITTEPEPVAEFYNEKGDIEGFVPATQELYECMEGQHKAFAWITYTKETDAVNIESWVLDEEDWPQW